ncbi:hypothetical protein BKA62DRAFT_771883 [Auriculariales sp. MPI-PUGE-AT-0066]|nr:hypothetical protein BKA62DRAFT_771883 [Auriculariales sp. MPI-PUGE-AT-0066]
MPTGSIASTCQFCNTASTAVGYPQYIRLLSPYAFAPNYLNMYRGDTLNFIWTNGTEQLEIVRAKSRSEPCTRLDDRVISAGGKSDNPDGTVQYIIAETDWDQGATMSFYSPKYCEQGMRATVQLSNYSNGLSSDSSVAYTDSSLSAGSLAGIIVGSLFAFGLVIALIARNVYRARRAKQTQGFNRRVEFIQTQNPPPTYYESEAKQNMIGEVKHEVDADHKATEKGDKGLVALSV